MLDGFVRFFRDLDMRVKVTLIGTGIHNWGQQLSAQYNLLFAQVLGANAVDIGILNSFGAGVNSIVSAPIGSAVEKYSVKRMMLLGLILEIISSLIFILAGNWLVLIPALVMHGQLIRIMPLTDVIFITYTEPHRRSTVMSLSRVFWGILNVFAPITAAVIITNFGGISAQGIRPLYYIQLVVYIIVFLIIVKGIENPSVQSSGRKDKSNSKVIGLIQDYRELLKGEKHLKRWIIIRMVQTFGMALSAPFITLWMVNNMKATPAILGTVGTISIVAAFILQIPAGRLADKIGRKKAFYLFSPFKYAGTLLLVSSLSPEYLVFVGLLGGVSGGVGGAGGGIGSVGFTPFITMFWEMAPANKRGRWYGIEGTITAITRVPASIIGGILWEQGFMIEVLVFPILLEVLVVLPLLSTIPDTLGSKR